MHHAFSLALEGSWPAVRAAVRAKRVDPNAVLLNTTLLCIASGAYCRNSDLATVTTLLKAGADPNGHPPNAQCSALHVACVGGTPDVCAALISAGANVNAVSKDGETPFMLAARHVNEVARGVDRLQLLLEDPRVDLLAHSLDDEGMTAEEWARDNNDDDLGDYIALEVERRERWSPIRVAWMGTVMRRTIASKIRTVASLQSTWK